MTKITTEALNERIDTLETEIKAQELDVTTLTKSLVETISALAADHPQRAKIAERLRSFGDNPGLNSRQAHRLMDMIADRIETAGDL